MRSRFAMLAWCALLGLLAGCRGQHHLVSPADAEALGQGVLVADGGEMAVPAKARVHLKIAAPAGTKVMVPREGAYVRARLVHPDRVGAFEDAGYSDDDRIPVDVPVVLERFGGDLVVDVSNGRTLTVPLAWVEHVEVVDPEADDLGRTGTVLASILGGIGGVALIIGVMVAAGPMGPR